MKPNKFDAVLALVGGEVSNNGGEFIYHNGQKPPTEKEINDKIAELQNLEPMRLLRQERDKKLAETDWWTIRSNDTGVSLTQEQKDYKQALRDLPSTASPQIDENGQLINVTWPTKPE